MFGKLKLNKKLILLFAVLILGMVGFRYAENLFKFPMRQSPVRLSGNFGELRTNHFHSGLDIKTGGVTGKPIYAIEDGYVYRLKVSPYGFGKAVYLKHPDGKFSVYAHLNGFNNQMADFIYAKQYATKKYEQEIYLSPNRISVKRGDIIAYSGNSGSSSGPHLHFEIRDPDERILNPMKYFPALIADNIPPVVNEIAFEPIGINGRVNGKFEKAFFSPNGSNGVYEIPGVIKINGRVGLEYHAWDRLNSSNNHVGVNTVKLFLDGKLIYQFSINRFSFDEKKYINLHFDYDHWKNKKVKFQRCYLEDGNEFSGYSKLFNRGMINLKDTDTHRFRLELSDTYGNTSKVTGRIKKDQRTGKGMENISGAGTISIKAEIKRGLLKVVIKNPKPAHKNGIELIFGDGEIDTLFPAYFSGNKLIFLHKINAESHPSKVREKVFGKTVQLNIEATLFPDRNNVVETGDLHLLFPYKSVFDTLPLMIRELPAVKGAYSKAYEIGNQNVPLFRSFVVGIDPNKKVPISHMVIAKKNRWGSWVYAGRETDEKGGILASSGYFGSFCIMADSNKPYIRASNFSSGKAIPSSQKSLSVKITDNFSGINSKRILMTLDQSWVLGEFDAKTSKVTWRWKERPTAGKHLLEIEVYDNAANLGKKTFVVNF